MIFVVWLASLVFFVARWGDTYPQYVLPYGFITAAIWCFILIRRY